MALQFGFGLYDEDNRKIWQRKYQDLSKEDQEVCYDFLPAILMLVDIGEILPKTIPHIIARLQVHRPDWYKILYEKAKGSDLKEYLNRFIGYRANVLTISTKEHIKKINNYLKYILPDLSNVETVNIRKQAQDAILDVATPEELPILINRNWCTKESEDRYKQLLSGGTR